MASVLSSPQVGSSTISGALQKFRNRSEVILDANVLFQARVSPNLSGILFLPYRVTPRYPNWCGVTVVPVFDGRPIVGTLGVEVVSPDRQILCRGITYLNNLQSYQPVRISFPPIQDSGSGVYELRISVRDAQLPVSILEKRFLSPVYRLRRWRARPLCKLIYKGPETEVIETDDIELTSGRWKQPLTYELASSVGSSSLEDHYWCSGWQTANVQLLVDLQPEDSILDIGCGVGRLAYGFHGWYGGRYVGVDVMPEAIDYCKKTFPRFEFYHLDVKSPYYNPKGALEPAEMILPVENQTFDVAVLYSVYTHLLPPTFLRMTSEISRTLKPGGRCLASFLILDGQTERAIFSFSHP